MMYVLVVLFWAYGGAFQELPYQRFDTLEACEAAKATAPDIFKGDDEFFCLDAKYYPRKPDDGTPQQ